MFFQTILSCIALWWSLSFACSVYSRELLLSTGEDYSPLLLTGLEGLVGCAGACVFGGVSLRGLYQQVREGSPYPTRCDLRSRDSTRKTSSGRRMYLCPPDGELIFPFVGS